MMKFTTRSVVVVAMIAGLGISAPAIATADTTTAPTTTTTIATTTTTIHKTSDAPWKKWRKTENAYIAQLKVINRTFRATVDVARREYWAAIKASKGSDNRQAARAAARAALTVSIANAMEARATALTTLGAPPAPPAGAPRSAYIVALQAINQTYRNSVAAADAAFAAAFPSATTAAERLVVRDTLNLAVAQAAVVRAAALVALGPPPASSATTPTTTTTVPATTTTI
ncbi:MAG TPA: hypothetical protein VIJ08_00590 [Acidimicrobiales bacterium]